MSRNNEHRPNGAAAEGGTSVFFVSANLFFILWIFMDIPYIFLYIFHIYIPCIGGWGCESNREIISFLRWEWVRETMCFLSLGRAAPTCAPAAPAPSLVFPCVFSVNPVFVVFDQWIQCESTVNPMCALSPTPNPPYQPQAGLIGIYFLNMFHILSLVCVLNLWSQE